jgi:RNA polymerase sigma factor (TIGR02999 family)
VAQSPQELTALLVAWRNGDQEAFDKLALLVYDELRQMAHRYLKRQPAEQTLQTTALVHEAYLRLVGRHEVDWQNRAHFFAVCAQIMRNLLVDRARARLSARRGGARQVSLDEAVAVAPAIHLDKDVEVLALNQALERLSALDPRKSRIVELRYFGGMSVEETAEVLALSPITIKREWLKAKLWLYHELLEKRDDS